MNPLNPNDIVITAFSGGWGENAPLWHSTDGGLTWTKQFTVPAPPGVSAFGCPCDQTIDYGRGHGLSGTFLVEAPNFNVYSGTTTNPASPANWNWLVMNGVTQRTNNNVPSSFERADQPWLLVNPDPMLAGQDNVYVAYDDFSGGPDMRVAVAQGTNPPNFTLDRLTGFATGAINPGHRLAIDPRTGFVYSLFQRNIGFGQEGSKNIDYMLNRSTDGGQTWGLNGSATGIIVANADSTQPTPKFGTVNALLGGVLHAAVDPATGDLYYVYGNRDPVTGNNRLALRRIVSDGNGGVSIGPQAFVTGQVQAALPSVAVDSAGKVGVFHYTFDGFSADGFPIFTAHLALSADRGLLFTALRLLTFLSSAQDNGNSRQRVLGDYVQMKTVGDTFFGAFTGNGVAFGRPFANHDPIFFRTSLPTAALGVNQPSYHRSDTLTLAATATPGSTPQTVDIHIALQLPDGRLLFWQGDLNFTPAIQPLMRNWTVTPFNSQIFTYTFGGTEAVGSYTWLVAFTVPGTLDILAGIAQAPFTFSP